MERETRPIGTPKPAIRIPAGAKTPAGFREWVLSDEVPTGTLRAGPGPLRRGFSSFGGAFFAGLGSMATLLPITIGAFARPPVVSPSRCRRAIRAPTPPRRGPARGPRARTPARGGGTRRAGSSGPGRRTRLTPARPRPATSSAFRPRPPVGKGGRPGPPE